MRRVIANAEVGDDVFGDDPTVIRLEEYTAKLLGKEAALFVPSGTMANEVAIAAHTERGDEVMVECTSHTFLYEGGGPALLSGVQLWPLQGDRGLPSTESVRSAVRTEDPHHPISRLLVLENTHNKAGGRVLPKDKVEELCAVAHEHGLLVHLDGARLWNAAAATGISEGEWAGTFDSVGVCLSKGLGAPVGSVVAGSKSFIHLAHHYRKRFGGGMRQAGIIAAAGLHAIRNHRERLVEDHNRARWLAEELSKVTGLLVDPSEAETNIVYLRLADEASPPSRWVEALKEENVLIVQTGHRELRVVTHLDLDDEAIRFAVEAFHRVARALGSSAKG
jgi:threonine aldolase